jgi:hypothetical protein
MKEIKAVLSRDYGWKETAGGLYIFEGYDVLFHCFMIELPLFRVPMRLNWQKIDCIPGGMIYTVKKTYRLSGAPCFQVMDVPGRTAVLWHIGNYATGKKIDTEGCQLPGMELVDLNNDGELDVAHSTEAMETLLDIMPDTFKFHIL